MNKTKKGSVTNPVHERKMEAKRKKLRIEDFKKKHKGKI
jgi:hypothetical protein